MASDAKQEQNVSQNPRIERDRQLIRDARAKGRGPLLGAFVRLSGPGWLQSAITLGGGSLSSSLYLGVLGGFMFMWLQPLAMVAGIVMLSAIAYVTLSTGKRPLRAINEHINPVLGWGWLLASMMANLVWSMPQFALATAALRQNLLPGLVGEDAMPDLHGRLYVSVFILAVAVTASMLYTVGGKGMKIFEIVVKCMVGVTVLSFIGVVTRLTMTGQLPWNEIFAGFVPNLRLLYEPTPHLTGLIDNVAAEYRAFWSNMIVGQQRDVMISAAATAVGINMTFLFPYSMLRKGWDRDFRGLAIFDLSTGLFFPFLLATSCVVIASASQFHAQPGLGLVEEYDETGQPIVPAANLVGSYEGLLRGRLAEEMGPEFMSADGIQDLIDRLTAKARRRFQSQLDAMAVEVLTEEEQATWMQEDSLQAELRRRFPEPLDPIADEVLTAEEIWAHIEGLRESQRIHLAAQLGAETMSVEGIREVIERRVEEERKRFQRQLRLTTTTVLTAEEIWEHIRGLSEARQERVQGVFGTEAVDAFSERGRKARFDAMDEADRHMAAVLARRDAFNLSDSLSPLVGRQFSHYVFGIGVLGMAMGAATMLMLINGLCFCELLNRPAKGWTQRAGSLMVCVGVLGPFFWTDAQMWLAIPTSVFAMTLLPFAYFSFYLLMNQKTLLGADMPRGLKRIWWNILMAIAAGLAAGASLWSLYSRLGWYGFGLVGLVLVLMGVVHAVRKANRAA